ncbi:MAG: arginine--tRNA ligase [Desulfovibrio sp.]|jgi:arginyl-tRNA synthetase|nr:arginine--tRNA ligase [Desulfovibrio sp.]
MPTVRATALLNQLLEQCAADLGLHKPDKAVIEVPKDKKFGDLAVNWAMALAKETKQAPRPLAEKFAAALLASSEHIAAVDVAGPGFLNVTLSPAFLQACIPAVESLGDRFGSSQNGQGVRVQVEFVSANPTGPLHIGHGRGAAVGDSLARILRFAGFDVEAEYYINDAGRQMRTLGLSILMRAREIGGKSKAEDFPEDGYRGAYITDIAADMLKTDAGLLSLPEEEALERCRIYGSENILAGIRRDLENFNVHHDVWFSERSLTASGAVERALRDLKDTGYACEKDGALWFTTTDYGDDKDRVLRKSDGSTTYFASDIAYHADKFRRGFMRVIDVWGADHHGYVARMKAAVVALGRPEADLDVVLVQLVNLLQDGRQIAMSTRAGTFETLSDVIAEVGTDAARFMFLTRKSAGKLDFDLALARRRSMDNPVYYVQYAHARVCALRRRAAERGMEFAGSGDTSLLVLPEELGLLRTLDRFPVVVEDAARTAAPHLVSFFLMELAGLLHSYYAAQQILTAELPALAAARLRLLEAVRQCLKNGLNLIGVSAPTTM